MLVVFLIGFKVEKYDYSKIKEFVVLIVFIFLVINILRYIFLCKIMGLV